MKFIFVWYLRVSKLLPENLVLIGRDLALIPVPNGCQIAQVLIVEQDRILVEDGVFFNYFFHFLCLAKLGASIAKVHHDLCAALKSNIVHGGQFELATSIR